MALTSGLVSDLDLFLELINESKNFPMLKQIKKFNKQTNQNLIDQVIGQFDSAFSSIDVNQLPIALFTFICDLEISKNITETTQPDHEELNWFRLSS